MPFPTGRALLDPVKILQNAGLTEGQVYADFGCGTLGYFVLPATDLVGLGGKVYALDILGLLQIVWVTFWRKRLVSYFFKFLLTYRSVLSV